jgi:hypothetical protein
MEIARMWINQPSELQPFHKFHATNVLVHTRHYKSQNGINQTEYNAYFLSGDTESVRLPSLLYVAEGWLNAL